MCIRDRLRWARTVRDARPWGYAGLIFTHGLGWALLNLLASGLSPLSLDVYKRQGINLPTTVA